MAASRTILTKNALAKRYARLLLTKLTLTMPPKPTNRLPKAAAAAADDESSASDDDLSSQGTPSRGPKTSVNAMFSPENMASFRTRLSAEKARRKPTSPPP